MIKILKIIIISAFLLLSNNVFSYDYIYRDESTWELKKSVDSVITPLGLYTDASYNNFRISKDSSKIIYQESPYIRVREINWTWQGNIVINIATWFSWFDFSSDWDYIYYTNPLDNLIYKKSAYDDSIWTVNNTIPSAKIVVYWDKIAYLDGRAWYWNQLIIKWINDLWIWTETGKSTYDLDFFDNWNKIILTSVSDWYKVAIYDIDTNNFNIISDVMGFSPSVSPDNINFFYNIWYDVYISPILSFSSSLYQPWIFKILFLNPIEPIWCYNIKTWYSFTWTTYKDLFKWENIDDYNIANWNTWFIYNYLILNNIINNNKYSFVFTATDPENLDPVNYYLDWELCTEITCIKQSLFSTWIESYTQILNQNIITTNNQNILWFNTNHDNINYFALHFTENYNYTLYWRKNNNSNYEEIWWLKTFDINWQGGESFNNTSLSWAVYSDFKIILPRSFLWFSTYFRKIVIWYWWSYQTTYGEVCNYEDGTITLDGELTDSWSLNDIIWSVPVEKSFEDISIESIWDLDIDRDGNISVFEYTIAPITIAKNVIMKLNESLKNIWKLLKEIMEIWNIWFIPNTYAESWILDNIAGLTLWVYNWEKQEVSQISWIIMMTKYGFMFAVFFAILFLFFYFRFLKN